eukprot:3338043-Pyramimonas_sp.AAC.1
MLEFARLLREWEGIKPLLSKDFEDWMLHTRLFKGLEVEFGSVAVSACADEHGRNSHTPRYRSARLGGLRDHHAFTTHQELGFFRGIVSICTTSVGIVAREDFNCLNGPLSSSMGRDFGHFGPRGAQRIVT